MTESLEDIIMLRIGMAGGAICAGAILDWEINWDHVPVRGTTRTLR